MKFKKILIVMDGYFPGKRYGGPPVSVNNFCSLMNAYKVYIVTRDHDLNSTERYNNISSGWNELDNCIVKYLKDSDYCYNTFENIIDEIQPDCIYLQSLFQRCVLPCLRLANKYGIKTVLAPRGELCKGAFKKKYKKLPYIWCLRLLGLFKNIYFHSTSDEETESIKRYLNKNSDHIRLLTNIPSIPKIKFSKKKKERGIAKIIFLSRIHPKKNLKGAIEFLSQVTGNVTFDIYGPKEDLAYWDICMAEIDNLPDNVKVNYCGLVTFDKIHETFNNYDVFLFPTFSENYGHVIAESLFAECPVIISDKTPWNDINDYNAGYSIPLDNPDGFVEAIQSIIDSDSTEIRDNAKKYIVEKHDINMIYKEYCAFFE